MSFVSNILEAATDLDLDRSFSDIQTDIEVLEKNILEHVEDVFVKFKHRKKFNAMHANELFRCQQMLNDLRDRIDLSFNTKPNASLHLNLRKQVQEKQKITENTLQGLISLRNILTLIDDSTNELEHSQFVNCDQTIQSLKGFLNDISSNEGFSNAVRTLQMVVVDMESRLHQKLDETFADNFDIIWDEAKSATTIRIKEQNEEMENLLALCNSEARETFLHQLAHELWKHVFIPVVNKSAILTEHEVVNYNLLTLNEESSKKANYTTVFNNLEKVVNFLVANFPYTMPDNTSVLRYIGTDFDAHLSDLIVKNCLKGTIPSNAQDLQNYKTVIDATANLEKTLLESQIFTSSTASILEYAGQAKDRWIDKMCRKYTMQAKGIMKKSLMDLVEVGVAYNPQDPFGSNREFPQCSVSKHVEELLLFCDHLLNESLNSDSNYQRFIAVSNIMSTYCVFAPEFHNPYLSRDNAMPQAAAVFMNNCLYIAAKSSKWDKLYVEHLKTFSFVAEAINMSTTGRHTFIKCVLKQVKQINETMKGAKLDVATRLNPNTKQCVRQCLKQQEKLQKDWQKILSYAEYNKTIGTCVNVLCKHFLPATNLGKGVREGLLDVIKLILTGAPKLFMNPDEIALHVPLWDKLNEFVFELSSVQISEKGR